MLKTRTKADRAMQKTLAPEKGPKVERQCRNKLRPAQLRADEHALPLGPTCRMAAFRTQRITTPELLPLGC